MLRSLGSVSGTSSRWLVRCLSSCRTTTGLRKTRVVLPRLQRHSFSNVPAVPSSSSSSLSNHNNNNNNVPAVPIDFWTAAKIQGEESHVAMVTLQPGEVLRAESGAMLFMTEHVVMETQLAGASAALNRFLTGQNVFLTDFQYNGPPGSTGTVGLGTDFPSKILRFSLEEYYGGTLICQRGAFLASNPTVNIEMEFTKSLSAGFFGGQGFILQRLSGTGDVLIKGGGTIVNRELADGEVLRVTSGSIVAFESSVQYEVGMMPGIKNVMFGGEGLFITTLRGPGQVWLQGMPADRMIAEIARRVPGPGIGVPIPLGIGGGGGGGDAGTDGVDTGTAGMGDEAATAAVGGEEAVAATDAAIEADRQATVASSGAMDADSQSALFGDAVSPASDPTSSSSSSAAPGVESVDSMSDSSSFGQETSFGDDSDFTDQSTFSNETTFKDDDFRDSFGDPQQGGDMFDDSTIEGLSGGAEEAVEQGSSIFSMLWDLISGGDD